jgi:hypothetical protein
MRPKLKMPHLVGNFLHAVDQPHLVERVDEGGQTSQGV